jgi:hypothetical protein
MTAKVVVAPQVHAGIDRRRYTKQSDVRDIAPLRVNARCGREC